MHVFRQHRRSRCRRTDTGANVPNDAAQQADMADQQVIAPAPQQRHAAGDPPGHQPPRKGARATALQPRPAQADRRQTHARPADGQGSSGDRELLSLSLLLVEDVEVNRQVLGGLLEHASHLVCAAPDSAHALEICRQQEFDAILMDIHLPGMSGSENTVLQSICSAS